MKIDFLISSERSGSNFITKLINGHPEICGPSTKHLINPVLRNLFRYEPINNKNNWEKLLNDIHGILSVNFSVWRSSFSLTSLREIATIGDIKTLLEQIYFMEAKANSKFNLFIKENHVYEFLPLLIDYFSESKFIYLVRDPRDMALSWKKNGSHQGGVVTAAKQWKKDQQSILSHIRYLQQRHKIFIVRYEDLISNTKNIATQILNFLGYEYDSSILEFHKDELTQLNSKTQSAWSNISKSVITNNRGKFLNELSNQEIESIEHICRYEMFYFDYETINSDDKLDLIKLESIESLNSYELINKVVDRPPGVIENMEAKKRFYKLKLGKYTHVYNRETDN